MDCCTIESHQVDCQLVQCLYTVLKCRAAELKFGSAGLGLDSSPASAAAPMPWPCPPPPAVPPTRPIPYNVPYSAYIALPQCALGLVPTQMKFCCRP